MRPAAKERLTPATPWDEPRTRGLRTDGYSVLRGGRLEALRAAYQRGASQAELWAIAHAPGKDEFGMWWSDPEHRVTATGRRETPIPPHGWANLLYWLKHGRMFKRDGSIPFKEGDVPSRVRLGSSHGS